MIAATILIRPDTLPPLARTRLLAGHGNTVMGIAVAHDAARVASIDYDGVCIVRDEATLSPLAAQRLNGRGRGVALSPNGARLAGLIALRDHSDTRYSYDAFVADLMSDSTTQLSGERVRNVAWTPDSEQLILTGVGGFRVHDHSGTRLRDDEAARGWLAACVTADARRVYFIGRGQLGCLALDTARELPAPDIAPFAPPRSSPGWDSEGLALSRAGDRLTTGRFEGGLYIWDLATAAVLAELRWDGPRVFRTKAVFAPDGERLVASFYHVVTPHANGRVTHVLYDLRAHRLVGALDTQTDLTGFHATACFSADGRRVYVSEGHGIHVCDLA